jgi:hypothetical protein
MGLISGQINMQIRDITRQARDCDANPDKQATADWYCPG